MISYRACEEWKVRAREERWACFGRVKCLAVRRDRAEDSRKLDIVSGLWFSEWSGHAAFGYNVVLYELGSE